MTSQATSMRLAITMGDPTGIGPEIVSRFIRSRRWMEDAETPVAPLIVGDTTCLDEDVRRVIVHVSSSNDLKGVTYEYAALWAPSQRCESGLEMGALDAAAGRACFSWVESAIDLAQDGLVRGIVTAPIHKGAWHAAGISQPGHTEVLRDKTGTPHVLMMLACESLRVVLATIHVPLMSVGARLTTDGLVRDLTLLRGELQRYFLTDREPKVAVCGLNPHAGEGGVLGKEDDLVIAPAVHAARALGIDAEGPLPADACIPAAAHGAFDAVLTMYHDQGLPTVKTLGRRSAVNITLGLPFVRTSVDHGTAHDIAGKGLATDDSLVAAWNAAKTMILLGSALNPARPPSDLTS